MAQFGTRGRHDRCSSGALNALGLVARPLQKCVACPRRGSGDVAPRAAPVGDGFLYSRRFGTARSLGTVHAEHGVGAPHLYVPGARDRVARLFVALCRAAPAATLGAKPVDAFFSVVLPLVRPGVFTATVLTFAHTIGEFGVVLMIGGNIPGKTQVVSTEIYTFVEAMEYDKAHILAGGMLVFSFVVLLALSFLNRRAKAVSF